VEIGTDRSGPGAWRIAGAILALPFMVTVLIPAAIVAGGGATGWRLDGVARTAAVMVGVALIAAGLAVFVWTVRLFERIGRGTLAPWDPPERLVVAGPYRHLRHPMITGVALVLAGETLALGSTGIAVVLGAFVAINTVYLPFVEEPALMRRFGADYERYMANVGRWIPRLRPWEAMTARDTHQIVPRRVNPSELFSGTPYDYASVAPADGLVFTAGACPLDADGTVVAPGDFEAQARQTLDNLAVVLAEAGSGFEYVLTTTVYVATNDRLELKRVFDVVEERFAPARPPSTLLGVSLLGYPDQLVEIEAIALRSAEQ
jgi:protein-S-isoprenylcysteine O-methyltransferase Ste14